MRCQINSIELNKTIRDGQIDQQFESKHVKQYKPLSEFSYRRMKYLSNKLSTTILRLSFWHANIYDIGKLSHMPINKLHVMGYSRN